MSVQDKPILDIKAAVNRLDGDTELYAEVGQIYLEDAPEILAKLTEAISAGDREALERHAHSLKSASANIGAERARAAAFAIERVAETAELSALESLKEELAQTIAAVIPVLTEAIKQK